MGHSKRCALTRIFNSFFPSASRRLHPAVVATPQKSVKGKGKLRHRGRRMSGHRSNLRALCVVLVFAIAECSVGPTVGNQPKPAYASMRTLPPVTSAALVTAGAMYPVDIVRAMRMAEAGSATEALPAMIQRFYQTHGIGGFVNKGIGAELLKCTFSRVVKFWLQPTAHLLAFGKSQKEGTPLTKGAAGALTTIPEMLVISPFENAKLVQQLDKTGRFATTGETLKFLGTRGGPTGLYTGWLPMQARQALWTGGFFLSLDTFKEKIEALNGGKKTATTDVMAGFCAGVFGTLFNCWPDVIRTQIQKKNLAAMLQPTYQPAKLNPQLIKHAFGNMATTSAEIFAAKGVQGLYAGMAVKSFYLGGSGALLAVLVPRFKELWGCNAE